MEKWSTSEFVDSKTSGKIPVKLGGMVFEKFAWKSVYRISDFTVVAAQIAT